ncbi:MAG TPA: 2-polyprenyl-3-methyl-6-methoxy-1,4-benzoquinone monooxygenase [Gammaproteobacteria bacterium]|nr:2-polyprenyl-3-methyl-6-methoxy-1,4-benzoquinone monooxygenase [Gammaproteobacteria bacterium]
MESVRHYSLLDRLVMTVDNGLRTVCGRPPVSERPDPADAVDEADLGEEERRLAARLMRVNHAGEVSAQALYQGQALTARLPEVRDKMERAALEENDHLVWCERRCRQLGGHVSLLNPFWYAGSLAIGALAGAVGDKWSLGFIVETERQVVRHLEDHLARLPARDAKSRAILEQMKEDEAHHATTALKAGGAPLPAPVKRLMGLTSKVMTGTAYWV